MAVAVVLILVGLLSVLSGIVLSAASNCCGSSEPADSTPALIGLGLAAAMVAGSVGLWSGRVPRSVLLLCGAAVPVVVVAVSPSSSDFTGLVPFAVLGWIWLWWYLHRPAVVAWVGRGTRGHP